MPLQIDKKSPVPIYYQIQEQLREAIQFGDLRPGDALPNEEDLAANLGISRMTVRHALTELAREGLIRRERGRGSFVERQRPLTVAATGLLMSYSEIFAGQQVSSRVLSQSVEPADDRAAHELGLAPGEPIVRVRRLRLLDGAPMSLETGCYPHRRFGPLAEFDLSARSVYRILEEEFGVRPEEAVEVVELARATAYEAELLAVPVGAPVFLARRTSYDSARRPVEYTKAIARSDRHRFVSKLTFRSTPERPGAPPPDSHEGGVS